MFETIVALATPPLKSALAIVRMSGDDCFDVVARMFSKDPHIYQKNTIVHGFIKDGDEIVDDVVALVYIAPHSYTGENSVEIMCHGSPLIFTKIIKVAIKSGARQAERGEYTSRAYLHGKMDLIQAESVNDLINAETEASKKLSLFSLTGKVTSLIAPLKESIASLLSNIEVNIDYPEYTDIEEANYDKVISVATEDKEYIDKLIKSGEKGTIIKEGIDIAIVGKPNVGKSSILNALIDENKAIVTAIKGTTRDVVEGKMVLAGVAINLYDTAGIRESEDLVEEIGIDKSKKQIEKSDIVILVLDDTPIDAEDSAIMDLVRDKKTIVVYNKEDLIEKREPKRLYISALKNDIEPLKKAIISTLGLSEENYDSPSLSNARQLGILSNIKEKLVRLIEEAKERKPIDLISVDVKDIYMKILSLTGEDEDFDIAKEIFSRFCVGK
jgi:tRNA modification GTPase